ncbi:MAG: hypothetical protein IRY85_04060 [Micromonosporaceae bacterium]|nr:hypothetical protein [Micromonosporaceae bacterium]
MWVVVSVVTVVVAVATYVTWVATRVDRLHARALAARAALYAQSERRANAAAQLGERESFAEALTAAEAVLAAGPEERPEAENRLTRALRLAADKFPPETLAEVAEASRRLALARQLHSDLVRDARAVRQRPLVRMLGLTRRHPTPEFFDIDDPALEP